MSEEASSRAARRSGSKGSESLNARQRELLERIAAARASKLGVAVVGLDCRLPGAPDYAQLWPLLRDGVDAVREVPTQRGPAWDRLRRAPWTRERPSLSCAGFLDSIDQFDADFFGISAREAQTLDPQHRLLLRSVWHALEDAGVTRARLAGSRTGVYVAVYHHGYARLAYRDPALIDAYTTSGTHHGIAANRLSYWLDLRGPSLVVDTACSSSLVALHLALRALRAGEIDRAIVAAANSIVDPDSTLGLSRWGMLAGDARCKVFDARADGFVRGEGVVSLVLMRSADAREAGERARAELLGSAVNQDGRSNGLTAPSGAAQEEVLRAALADAHLDPTEVTMIEAHGTGTALGDPIEAEALDRVYGPGARACAIGSIKTNIGHLEAAAGLAGLAKAIACIEHEAWAPSLHFEELNPQLRLAAGSRLFVSRVAQRWTGRRIAGVSSFGMGGTNAHVLVASVADDLARQLATDASAKREEALLPLSAHSPEALRELVQRWRVRLREAGDLHGACAGAARRRSHHRVRCFAVGEDPAQMVEDLDAWLETGAASTVANRRRGLVFVFPGQGSQWVGMGRGLYEREPAYREALDRCDAVVAGLAGFSVVAELHGAQPRLGQIEVVQPLLFSLAVAAAALWRSAGMIPEIVVGHSMGEIAAATVAEALTLDDGARIVVERSRRMKRLRGRGAMTQISAPAERVAALLDGDRGLAIAAHNGPESTVVSGPLEAIIALEDRLEAAGVERRRVDVEVASHHADMDELRAELLDALAGLSPRAGVASLRSTVTAAPIAGEELGPSYWFRNLREPVRLWPVVEGLLDQGYREFVEVSPHPILLPGLAASFACRGAHGVASSRRASARASERAAYLRALGELYAAGHEPDWEVVCPGPASEALPPYPFVEQRHWLPEPARGDASPTRIEQIARAVWREAPSPARADVELGRVLLIGAPASAAAQLELELEQRGAAVEQLGHDALAGREVVARALEGRSFDRVLCAHGLGDLDDLGEAEPPIVLALLDVLVALAERGGVTEVLVATRAAWTERPGAAAIWGLVRVAANEHPNLELSLVDLDLGVATLALIDELGRLERGVELRLTGAGRLAGALELGRWIDDSALGALALAEPWLEHVQAAIDRGALPSPALVRGDASYLITGGCGGLGLELARRFVAEGARCLVLVSRSGPDPSARAAIERWRGEGVEVHTPRVDVSAADAVAELFAWVDRELAPLRGVVHCAAQVEDGVLATTDRARIERVWAAKVRGAAALDRHTRARALDFFVLCSSLAATIGKTGQGVYAAANAALDALTSARRARGLAGQSIAWGLIGDVGHVARSESLRLRLTQLGLQSLRASDCAAWLARTARLGAPRLVVADVDWGAVAAASASALVASVVGAGDASAADGVEAPGALTPGWREAAEPQRRAQLLAYLRQRVAAISRARLELVEPSRPLAALGFDSLMAVELRNRVWADTGVELTAVTVLACEGVDELVTRIDGALTRGAIADEQLEWDEFEV